MGEDFLKNDIVKYPDNLVGKLCVLSCVFLNGEKIFFKNENMSYYEFQLELSISFTSVFWEVKMKC